MTTQYEYNPLHLAICYNANDIVNYIMNNNELKFMMNEIDLVSINKREKQMVYWVAKGNLYQNRNLADEPL